MNRANMSPRRTRETRLRSRERAPKPVEIRRVEDDPFERAKRPLEPNLGVPVQDARWRERVDELRHDAALEGLFHGGSVEATRNAGGAQERHEQGRLGVALPIAVRQHTRRREIVRGVVPERNLVSNEAIDGRNALAWADLRACQASFAPPLLEGRMVEVEQLGRCKQTRIGRAVGNGTGVENRQNLWGNRHAETVGAQARARLNRAVTEKATPEAPPARLPEADQPSAGEHE